MIPPELQALREAAVASAVLAARIARLKERLASRFPVAGDIADWDDDAFNRLHAFFHMFEQLHDLTARRLLRGILLIAAEDSKALSYKAVVRRVETLAGIDGDRWLDLGATRNGLVHDYPTSVAVLVKQANDAWRDLPSLLDQHAVILQYLKAEGVSS